MLRQIVKIANKLDSLGLTKEADVLDRYIQKVAQESYQETDYGMSQDSPYDRIMRDEKLKDAEQRAQTYQYEQKEMKLAESISEDVIFNTPDYLKASPATFKDSFMKAWLSSTNPRGSFSNQEAWRDTGIKMANKMWDKYGRSDAGTAEKPPVIPKNPKKRADLTKFYASKPATLSEFNGLLGQLVEEIGKIPGQDVFSKEIIDFRPKQGDTAWSNATNLAFREYANAAGFPEAGGSWANFAKNNRYQPNLFGIYKFWENTIGKVLDKAKSDFSTTFSIGEKGEGKVSTFADMPTPSSSPQATTGGAKITEEEVGTSYKGSTISKADVKIQNQ